MPSFLLSRLGFERLISGNYWSGQQPRPVYGVELHLDRSASGNAYIALSGGATFQSGHSPLSGVSADAGLVLTPGSSRYIPKALCGPSGSLNLFGITDAAASGQARLYLEIM
jgi:hypothetical protein